MKWRYPCERLTIAARPTPPERQLKLVTVGASFSWELLRQLSSSGQFSETDLFFYYKVRKSVVDNGNVRDIRGDPATPLDFEREIFGADCLLLEINEASALYPEHHLSHFVADALAAQPAR